MRQDIEASVIGGLLIGGLTPNRQRRSGNTGAGSVFNSALPESLRGYPQAGEKQKPNRRADGLPRRAERSISRQS